MAEHLVELNAGHVALGQVPQIAKNQPFFNRRIIIFQGEFSVISAVFNRDPCQNKLSLFCCN